MEKWNKEMAEHEHKMTQLKYAFAFKFASLICFSVVSALIILCLFLGITKTLNGVLFAGGIIIVLGIISFTTSLRGASAI